MSRLVVMDIDGTMNNFKYIDNKIIAYIFKSKIIKWLDTILWHINGAGIISNRFFIFRLRILLYSILSCTRYRYNMLLYHILYLNNVKSNLPLNICRVKNELVDSEVLFLTYNKFCTLWNVEITNSKRKYLLNLNLSQYDVVYMVGNNYMDDILLGSRLESIFRNIKVIYIGKNNLIKRLTKNTMHFKNIDMFLEYIKNE